MKGWRSVGIWMTMLVLWCGLGTLEAHAHATITQSFPHDGASLAQSPPFIRLQFNERIAHETSQMTLTHKASGVVVAGTQEAEDAYTVRMKLPLLETGEYVLTWKVLSADTHVADGSFTFAVGQPLSSVAPSEPIAIDGTSPQKSPLSTASPALDDAKTAENGKNGFSREEKHTPKEELPSKKEGPSSATPQKVPQQPSESSTSEPQHATQQGAPKDESRAQTKREVTSLPSTQAPAVSPPPSLPPTTQGEHAHVHHTQGNAPTTMTWDGATVVKALLRVLKNGAMLLLVTAMGSMWVLRESLFLWWNRETVWRIRRRTIGIAIAGICAISWSQLLVLATQFVDPGKTVWTTMYEMVVMDRLGVDLGISTLLLFFLLLLAYAPQRDARFSMGLQGGVFVGYVFLDSLSTHAGTLFSPSGWTVLARTMHLVATLGWAGGILLVLWIFWKNRSTNRGSPKTTVPAAVWKSYTTWAIWSGAVIVLSGIFMAGAFIPSWRALIETAYGTLLLIKIGVFGVVAGLGFVQRKFGRTAVGTWMEGAVVTVLIGIATVIAMTPPQG
jgi:methionine-rich copper-binding protein CopC/putative copper export protein